MSNLRCASWLFDMFPMAPVWTSTSIWMMHCLSLRHEMTLIGLRKAIFLREHFACLTSQWVRTHSSDGMAPVSAGNF
ncbi:hypothetical protein X961_5073 [Burkholderia pseudomallei MSHR5613]|nr:hypothetical protein X961_5073 [Burkholderia pseudomallei MSHR5613]